MKIINSLKSENVKKFLLLSFLITIITIFILILISVISCNNKTTEIISKYEINGLKENLALEEIRHQINNNTYIYAGIILILYICITILFLTALAKNEKDIKKVRAYLKQISNQNYSFNFEDISESEMSNLQQEMYKIVLELKEKSENLAKDREALSNYLADISHQIRTPLMAITAMTDAIIENEASLDENTRRFIYKISNQINQINWLVNNLLKMTQLDTKLVEFDIQKVDVQTLVALAKDNLEIFLEEKNIELKYSLKENIIIEIDKKWMLEALENILKNCIEYSKPNSVIQIECEQNPLHTEIIIIDQGKGISKEGLPKIFDKFYKGRNASSNSFGIGLSLAKSIIERHNGEIKVKSEEGKGTTFLIRV